MDDTNRPGNGDEVDIEAVLRILKRMDVDDIEEFYRLSKGLLSGMGPIRSVSTIGEVEAMEAQGEISSNEARDLKEKLREIEASLDGDAVMQTRRLIAAFNPIVDLLDRMYGASGRREIILATHERVGRTISHFKHLNSLRESGRSDRELVEGFLCELKVMLRLCEKLQRDLATREIAERN